MNILFLQYEWVQEITGSFITIKSKNQWNQQHKNVMIVPWGRSMTVNPGRSQVVSGGGTLTSVPVGKPIFLPWHPKRKICSERSTIINSRLPEGRSAFIGSEQSVELPDYLVSRVTLIDHFVFGFQELTSFFFQPSQVISSRVLPKAVIKFSILPSLCDAPKR